MHRVVAVSYLWLGLFKVRAHGGHFIFIFRAVKVVPMIAIATLALAAGFLVMAPKPPTDPVRDMVGVPNKVVVVPSKGYPESEGDVAVPSEGGVGYPKGGKWLKYLRRGTTIERDWST